MAYIVYCVVNLAINNGYLNLKQDLLCLDSMFFVISACKQFACLYRANLAIWGYCVTSNAFLRFDIIKKLVVVLNLSETLVGNTIFTKTLQGYFRLTTSCNFSIIALIATIPSVSFIFCVVLCKITKYLESILSPDQR